MDLLVSYHRLLVEGLLLVLCLNLLLPWVLRGNPTRRILITRIGFFTFWAFWAMTVFSGLIVWIFAGRPLSLSIFVMWGAMLLLPVLDIYRAVKLRRLWLEEKEGLGFNALILLLEILVLIGTILVSIFAK
jgi:predicted membrane channel-forming protein YqfA (hemolysin III family)